MLLQPLTANSQQQTREPTASAPFFSIIVPVYNVAAYLRACLDSVLAQTFGDWECLCVDDGSSDGSGEILDEYAKKDTRFRVIHQVNGGVSAARNVALAHAQGKWIAFLDGDDLWTSAWLQHAHQIAATQYALDWIAMPNGDINFVDTPQAMLPTETAPFAQVNVPHKNVVATLWQQTSRCGYVYLHFFRRTRLLGHRFNPQIRFREDALFLFEVAFNLSQGIIAHNLKGYFRRIRPNGATYASQSQEECCTLLNAFAQLCQHTLARSEAPTLPLQARKAAAFWATKSIRAWHRATPACRVRDAFRVWQRAWHLQVKGIVTWSTGSTPWNTSRWCLFLLTGWVRCLGAQVKLRQRV